MPAPLVIRCTSALAKALGAQQPTLKMSAYLGTPVPLPTIDFRHQYFVWTTDTNEKLAWNIIADSAPTGPPDPYANRMI